VWASEEHPRGRYIRQGTSPVHARRAAVDNRYVFINRIASSSRSVLYQNFRSRRDHSCLSGRACIFFFLLDDHEAGSRAFICRSQKRSGYCGYRSKGDRNSVPRCTGAQQGVTFLASMPSMVMGVYKYNHTALGGL